MSVSYAKKVLLNESRAIARLSGRIDRNFSKIINFLSRSSGRIIVTGIGKPGFIAQKVSATLSSTGTPSFYLHPAEAMHGDLGRITRDDVILAFSNSGETEEVVRLLPIIKKIGAKIISVTGKARSTLAANSDYIVDSSVEKEACPMGLAPTTSTTVMLALGDALAVALLVKKKFKPRDFALYHPGGALGKRLLLKVEDIMRPKKNIPVVKRNTKVKEVLLKITKYRAGSASIVDPGGKLAGIFTDGDLRRHVDMDDVLDRRVGEVMTKNPFNIEPKKLAAEALEILKDKKIDEIPVVDNHGKLVGLLDVQDVIKAGLV